MDDSQQIPVTTTPTTVPADYPPGVLMQAASERINATLCQIGPTGHPSTGALSQALIRLNESLFWLQRAQELQERAMKSRTGIVVTGDMPPQNGAGP